MTKCNAGNERIKRQYFRFLREAKGQSEVTVDGVAKALDRFELYAKYRDFGSFHPDQAIAFKDHLAKQLGEQSGKPLSKATLHGTLGHLKRYFQWLACQPGYKSKVKYSDAEFFNFYGKEVRIATARREPKVPTLEQIKHVINLMPTNTELERRDRALVAFTLITGARDGAIASMKLKHVDPTTDSVYQDAREVKTKFSKTFITNFFPVGEEARVIVADWVSYLRNQKLWGHDDPLFPATRVEVGSEHLFQAVGLLREPWKSASPIRVIFRRAFAKAGLAYFNPHSFRNTLVRLAQQLCESPEEFKAWSQNLGHESPLTTFVNYGVVAPERQAEIIAKLATPRSGQAAATAIADAVYSKLMESGVEIRHK